MCILEEFLVSLYEFLTGLKYSECNIIRKHSRKLNELGDISFPLNTSNWYHLIDQNKIECTTFRTIFDYRMPQCEIDIQLQQLKEESRKWSMNIEKLTVNGNDVNVFVSRSAYIFKAGINKALTKGNLYGSSQLIPKKVSLGLGCDIKSESYEEIDLSTLRLLILRDVALRLLEFTTKKQVEENNIVVTFTLSSMKQEQTVILCGPVVNSQNLKDSTTKAGELLSKRTSDMRMMAQHKYGVQTQMSASWKSYFEKLGKAAVIIEMMSNKPHKALKLTMHDLQTAHKGCSFIFYNCARIAILFKELHKRIADKVYPELPSLEEVDFSLLTQPEEWELFYVYILQFPTTIKNCIRDIEKGIINPQHLVSFLSNLCSVFSAYYRRVRILTDPREHLFATLHARIYLLKALQCVFHNALSLLNIEPVKEM